MELSKEKQGTVGIVLISLYFVFLGIETFFFPIAGIRLSFDFKFIQAALIALNTPGTPHVVITLAVPFFGLVFGPLFFKLKAAGWWGIAVLSLFNAFLYLSAFIKSYVIDAVIRYENLFLLHLTDINFLFRAILYSFILHYIFKTSIMKKYGVKTKKVGLD